MSDREKDSEILAPRHQLLVLRRQVGKPAFTDTDRAFLASLFHHVPMEKLRRFPLLVHPDTIPRWHSDLLRRRHAANCVAKNRDARRRSGRPEPWSYAWPVRIPRGATGGTTVSSRRSASRSRPQQAGRSKANWPPPFPPCAFASSPMPPTTPEAPWARCLTASCGPFVCAVPPAAPAIVRAGSDLRTERSTAPAESSTELLRWGCVVLHDSSGRVDQRVRPPTGRRQSLLQAKMCSMTSSRRSTQ